MSYIDSATGCNNNSNGGTTGSTIGGSFPQMTSLPAPVGDAQPRRHSSSRRRQRRRDDLSPLHEPAAESTDRTSSSASRPLLRRSHGALHVDLATDESAAAIFDYNVHAVQSRSTGRRKTYKTGKLSNYTVCFIKKCFIGHAHDYPVFRFSIIYSSLNHSYNLLSAAVSVELTVFFNELADVVCSCTLLKCWQCVVSKSFGT